MIHLHYNDKILTYKTAILHLATLLKRKNNDISKVFLNMHTCLMELKTKKPQLNKNVSYKFFSLMYYYTTVYYTRNWKNYDKSLCSVI
jgi:hypothetical protein